MLNNLDPRLTPEDFFTWNEIHTENCYALPADMYKWGFIDIGGHIGSATCLAAKHGCEKIVTVEPNEISFALLQQNWEDFHVNGWRYYGAVVSDKCTDTKVKINSFDPAHRGATTTTWWAESQTEVDAIQLHTLIDFFDLRPSQPVMLKIDCEGAEFSILMESNLQYIDRIVGEIHQPIPNAWRVHTPYSVGGLLIHLWDQGLYPLVKQIDSELLLFDARRPWLVESTEYAAPLRPDYINPFEHFAMWEA